MKTRRENWQADTPMRVLTGSKASRRTADHDDVALWQLLLLSFELEAIGKCAVWFEENCGWKKLRFPGQEYRLGALFSFRV